MAWFPRGGGSLMTRSTPYWVLVVEDDPTSALLIKAVFSHRDEKAHVPVARSAEEAIAHLTGPWGDADFGHNVLPDIIVLDILMEGVGGFGFLAPPRSPEPRRPRRWRLPSEHLTCFGFPWGWRRRGRFNG